jgi:hypothetical protein
MLFFNITQKQYIRECRYVHGCTVFHEYPGKEARRWPYVGGEMGLSLRAQRMNLNSDEFQHFLHDLGVEMEQGTQREQEPVRQHVPESSQEEPSITMLQKSRDYQALYQVNLVQGVPQLRVVVPEQHGRLKFQIYLVQLSEQHPLVFLFTQFSQYQGSRAYEEERETAAWHLLFAMGEIMKDLFWTGVEASHFPSEITVQRLA